MAWSTLTARSAGDAILASDQNITAANFVELAPFFAAWTAYTPVWTNLTVGNATNTGRYVQIGKVVIYQGQITWGSTTTATGSNTTVSLPVTASSPSGISFFGSGTINDAGARYYVVACARGSATTMFFVHSGDTGTGIVTSTSPQTWASTDSLAWQVVYEAA